MAKFPKNKLWHIKLKLPFFLIISLCLFLFSSCGTGPTSQPLQANTSPVNVTPTPSPTPLPKPTPSPTPQTFPGTQFERGMIYPRWTTSSYGSSDPTWQQGIETMKTQTGATWLEIPVLFDQSWVGATSVWPGPNAPTVDSFVSGIQRAHTLGYHVFFAPLITVDIAGGWAGIIQVDPQQQQAWFDSYWYALKPYITAAQDNGVEQMAIGTEISWMQDNAPAALWHQLIQRVRSVFTGLVTYDMNWAPSLFEPAQGWMSDPGLSMLGVSEYISLIDSPMSVDPKAMPALWKDKVGKVIDALATQTGKQIVITEIGYRNTYDALYNPFNAQSGAADDQAQQAAAFDAALSNVFRDPHISGIFIWGWDDVVRLGVRDTQSVQVINKWYTAQGPLQ